MTGEKEQTSDLKNAVVRICPACGVVNPAGPSDTCPHLQLVRFRGIDSELSNLLENLAKVRNEFTSLVTKLRSTVMHAAKNGIAEVEITRKTGAGGAKSGDGKPQKPLVLSNPEPAVTKTKTKSGSMPRRMQKKSSSPKPVDPRQLALIGKTSPRGDA